MTTKDAGGDLAGAPVAEAHAIAILESMTDGFLALDRDWRITYANAEARRLLARDDLLGAVLWDAYPDLAASEFGAAHRAAMSHRKPCKVTAFYAPHDRWYEVRAFPTPDGISVFFRDETYEKRAEADRQRLVEQSERQRRIYEAALSNTPDLVYIFDLEHRFTYANEALLAMWGRTREEALGKNCLELGYEPWHAEMHDREIDQVVATRRSIRGEVPFTGTNGRRIYDYIFVPVLGADGAVVAVAGTTRDVTDRKAIEEAVLDQARQLREADRAKNEFLAMLSHELRNPLAPLRNALALVRMGAEPEQADRLHAMMERQVNHLVRLVDDLLEVSRLSRGEFALKKARIPVADIVRNAIETAQPLLQGAKHRLDVVLPDEPAEIHGDPVRLSQVLANLLDNAAKYTPQGGSIALRVTREEGWVDVSIEDNGIGIDPDVLPRMFEMFTRGEEASLRAQGGLGIGLALARRLVEMHGGEIRGHSEGMGKGSRFSVRLPVDADSRREAANQDAPEMAAAKRVLVIDDNADAADSLAMILARLGAEVRVARDVPEALRTLARFEPAIVLLDVDLPGLDGCDMAGAIRGRFPDHAPALVALTDGNQDLDRERVREAGFDHFLVKPADVGALTELLATLGGEAPSERKGAQAGAGVA